MMHRQVGLRVYTVNSTLIIYYIFVSVTGNIYIYIYIYVYLICILLIPSHITFL